MSYRTAWRMLNKIRNELMADDGEQLRGDVEVDEASVDGKPRKPQGQHKYLAVGPDRRKEAAKLRERSRATVFAAVERGGRITATVLPSRRGPALNRQVIEWVESESIIITDDWPAYNGLQDHFISHSRINHSAGYYVQGDTHTNTIEGSSATSSRRSGAPTGSVAPLATGLPERVHVALQPALSARPADVRQTRRTVYAMNQGDAIQALHRAAKRREAADHERHAASAELRKRVQDARAAGVSPTRIAREDGLSRQAVYEALGETPSRPR